MYHFSIYSHYVVIAIICLCLVPKIFWRKHIFFGPDIFHTFFFACVFSFFLCYIVFLYLLFSVQCCSLGKKRTRFKRLQPSNQRCSIQFSPHTNLLAFFCCCYCCCRRTNTLQTWEIRADGVMRDTQKSWERMLWTVFASRDKLQARFKEKKKRKKHGGKCPHAASKAAAAALSQQWNKVCVWWEQGKPGRWRWEAEPLIISWQDNNVPCCLSFFSIFSFFFYTSGATVRSGRSGHCEEEEEEGDVLFFFVWLWKTNKTVCSRSNEYFFRLALPLFVVLLFLTSIIRSVAMHAFVRKEGGAESGESFHLCMNPNHSAGGGRLGSRAGCLHGSGGRRKRRRCYVMRGGRSDEESQQRSRREREREREVFWVYFSHVGYLCSVVLVLITSHICGLLLLWKQ